jgi:DNA-directed RNA polymerase subunit RPC12/RpoP
LIEENRLLKIECDKHAQFELERACYVLHELAPGVLVYKFNPGVGDLDEQVATPNHYLCANCYEQGKKGYMQRFSQDHTGTHYRCSSCGSPVVDHVNKAQISIDVVSTGARRSSITYGY